MLTIEPMTLAHLDAVFEVEAASFSIPWTRESLRLEIENNKLAYYFVAVYKEKVIGYIGLWHVINEGHITNLAVLYDYRNHGVGDRLLKHVIAFAHEKEMIGLTLEVRMNNAAAQRVYTKNGFKMEGIRKNYYADTKEDAIVMWLNL